MPPNSGKLYGSWIPFESSKRRDAARFDVLRENRCFIRIRDRSRESRDSGRREYIVVNVCTLTVVDGIESFTPDGGGDETE